MTEQCKKEIEEYLKSKGWIDGMLYYPNNEIMRSSFVCSKKGYENNLYDKYIRTDRSKDIDKYFLEYVGFILRKYKVKEIKICQSTYQSVNWFFNTIECIKS